jgi:hypothetical protein
VVILSDQPGLSLLVRAIGNPFQDMIRLTVVMPETGVLKLRLMDIYGKEVAVRSLNLEKGTHKTGIEGLAALPQGMYLLQAGSGSVIRTMKLMKN